MIILLLLLGLLLAGLVFAFVLRDAWGFSLPAMLLLGLIIYMLFVSW